MKKLFQTIKWRNFFPKDPKRRKKLYIFSSFVLLSTLFWLIIKLSQDNETRLTFKVNLLNIPAELIVEDFSRDKFDVDLRTVGVRLFYINMLKQSRIVDVDFSLFHPIERNGSLFYYITDRQLAQKLPSSLQTETDIISVQPDTLFIKVKEAKTKNVPVVFNGSFEFLTRYRQYGEVAIEPAYILVSGPKNIVDKIDTLYTRETHFIEPDKPVEKSVEVTSPFLSESIALSDNRVNIFVDIREFTESKVEVALTVDCPDEYIEEVENIRLFPSRATIYYLVALDDYRKVTEDMFSLKVECPFGKESNNRLQVKVLSKPRYVEIMRVDPRRTEYILLR